MRTIRVKEENQEAIIAGLQKAGFEAIPCEAPLSEWEYELNNFESSNQTSNSTIGMSGVETSASGHQAHKIISTLKEQGIIN